MAVRVVPLLIPVRGPLDTTNPAEDRPIGTLVEAVDVGTRLWGPRSGVAAITNPHSHATLPGPAGNGVVVFDGNNDYVSGPFASPMQRDLGVQWTLDILCILRTAWASSLTEAPLVAWNTSSSIAAVEVFVLGSGAVADEKKIRVKVTPTSAPGVAGTTTTITSTSAIPEGVTDADNVAIRVIRDRGTVTLYINGTQEAQSTAVSTTQRHEGTDSDLGTWMLASDQNTGSTDLFAGRVWLTQMRDGVQSGVRFGSMDFQFPHNDDVKLHVVGGNNTAAVVPDWSRYKADGREGAGNSGSGVNEPPFLVPVQGMAAYTDLQGQTWNVVLCGGVLFWERIS